MHNKDFREFSSVIYIYGNHHRIHFVKIKLEVAGLVSLVELRI